MSEKALLVLENGDCFVGRGFGDLDAVAAGETVFNTAMSGYQEIMTDPSYYGQIMTFTYPHIGNCGVNRFDMESDAIQTESIVVKEYSRHYSNWRADSSLEQWMKKHGRIGIEGVDTRKLVRILRTAGVMRGIVACNKSYDELLELVLQTPSMEGLDLTGFVSTKAQYTWKTPDDEPYVFPAARTASRRWRVAALDFGVKRNILRRLEAHGCDTTVFPANTTADEILQHNPDGVFLSNGPGDPAAVGYAVESIKKLLGKKPIFGICLGHQLLGLAYGAKTYKLRFGHRGANHPVKNLLNGTIEISSQNHGFAVETESLPENVEPTHMNLNDNTLSGMRHTLFPAFSVQYHPEASPGPHDSDYLFAEFTQLMGAWEK